MIMDMCGESAETVRFGDGREGTGNTLAEVPSKSLWDHLESGLSIEEITSTTVEEHMEMEILLDQEYV